MGNRCGQFEVPGLNDAQAAKPEPPEARHGGQPGGVQTRLGFPSIMHRPPQTLLFSCGTGTGARGTGTGTGLERREQSSG